MSEPENLGAFIKENKTLLKEYLETRLEIIRLQGIKAFSKATGYIIWILISLFLVFLVIIFLGLVLGFWLSELSGNLVIGFGLTTLILIFFLALLAIFRKSLFVNPVIKAMISKLQGEIKQEEIDETTI